MANILVVEDNHLIRAMYVAGLSGFGHNIVEVRTFKEAIDFFEAGEMPDVILLDLELGDGFGQDLIPYVRHQLGRYDIRIVVSTATCVDADEILELSADAVLEKPVDMVRLLDSIHAFSY